MKQYQLIDLLKQPTLMLYCKAEHWNRILGHARQNKLLARLAHLAESAQITEQLPAKVQTHFNAAFIYAENHDRVVRWEIHRLLQAWSEYQGPIILLKGAAYQLAGLPPAQGRLISDVDLLCPRSDLPYLEKQLLGQGWEHSKLKAYDQRYYRQWMHELPPMKHWRRQFEIDLHHNILPLTGRLKPQAWQLIQHARPVQHHPRLMTLCPPDMLLHSAAHFFQDGDFSHGIRDLTDMDDLIRYFSQQDDQFWEALIQRAEVLDLQRPLFYALRYCEHMLNTPLPPGLLDHIQHWGPNHMILQLMDNLVQAALQPEDHRRKLRDQWYAQLSSSLLYARSHWMRMPPAMLTQHLMIKFWRTHFPESNPT